MSEKKLDVGALVNNGIGHPLARMLAKALWKTQIVRRFAAQNPGTMKVVSQGLVALTSLLEVGGDHPIARFANYLTETIATENLELLKQFEENPEDSAIAEEMEKRVDATVAKASAGDVVIVFDHVHKDTKCVAVAQLVAVTTTQRTGKDNKVFSSPSPIPITTTDMSSAIAAHKPLCGICFPAPSTPKAEAKQEKPSGPVTGKNFMEYLMRLRKEEHEEYETFWKAYLRRLDGPDGQELGRKFQDAFNGKHDYEAFRFVVSLPHRSETGNEEWHHALDALLGKVEPPSRYKDIINGFIDKELKETKEMFRALWEILERSNAERAVRIDEKREIGKKLDEEWAAHREAQKTRKTVKTIVFYGLLVILTSVYIVHRTTTTDRPATAEQKVETSNDR